MQGESKYLGNEILLENQLVKLKAWLEPQGYQSSHLVCISLSYTQQAPSPTRCLSFHSSTHNDSLLNLRLRSVMVTSIVAV